MFPTRRDFMKASLCSAALASLNASPRAWASGRRRDTDNTVLVLVELAGGNDGLNTLVPYENDIYGRSRTTLRLTGNDVLKINDSLGFHPEMGGFRRLYDEGHLSVVQGVGYPNPNGGHPEAMLDWQSAQPHQTNRQTGWIGRAIDQYAEIGSVDVPAVLVGQPQRPFCVNARRTIVPSIHSLGDGTLQPNGAAPGETEHRRRMKELADVSRHQSDNPLLDVVRQGSLAAQDASHRIERVIQDLPTSAGNYPNFSLAEQFRTAAQLIRADIGIRVLYTGFGSSGIGGFDNHAGQRDNHAALLRHLSESVAAFIDDLKRENLLDRVVLMTFSEFGRTVQENGRKGTGHASAAPVFLAGGKLRGGLVGEHPGLTELENGGPKHHTDFRRLYATMLESHLGMDSRVALGEGFEPLDVFEA